MPPLEFHRYHASAMDDSPGNIGWREAAYPLPPPRLSRGAETRGWPGHAFEGRSNRRVLRAGNFRV